MAKLFSFASWNVENFGKSQPKLNRCVNFIKTIDGGNPPKVFGIFEVKAKDVFDAFTQQMPNHSFFITEGVQVQDTIVGVHKSLTAFVSQREELKAKIPTLRPGVLVSLAINNQNYSLLFVHLKSFPQPVGWGLRDDMIGHILNLKKALNKHPTAGPNGANFLVLGDINTMGLDVTYSDIQMTGTEELERYDDRFGPKDMSEVPKSHNETWWGGGDLGPSNLDHVFASDHLNIPGGIKVKGWVEKNTQAQKLTWINQHSDHSLLLGTVHS